VSEKAHLYGYRERYQVYELIVTGEIQVAALHRTAQGCLNRKIEQYDQGACHQAKDHRDLKQIFHPGYS
jgi:hypothetical protein